MTRTERTSLLRYRRTLPLSQTRERLISSVQYKAMTTNRPLQSRSCMFYLSYECWARQHNKGWISMTARKTTNSRRLAILQKADPVCKTRNQAYWTLELKLNSTHIPAPQRAGLIHALWYWDHWPMAIELNSAELATLWRIQTFVRSPSKLTNCSR